jgi:hypothetical protein
MGTCPTLPFDFLWPQTSSKPLTCNCITLYSFSVNYAASVVSTNFHTQVSVGDLYIPRIGPHIFLYQNRQIKSWECVNCSQTHECGNWDYGSAITFLGIFVSDFRNCIPESGESGEALEVPH